MTEQERFREAYTRLSREGECDSYGGAESRRVFREWQALGHPEPLDAFIRASANRGPDSRAPSAN